jgi:DNA-binding MarR family transcriptional regulator
MTTVVDRLEDAGLVERVHDRVDRRRILVGVTVSAEKQWNELWGPLSAESRQRLEHYSNAELAAIANFLRGGREDNERQIERLRTSE